MLIFLRASVTAVFLLDSGTYKRFTRIVQGASSDYKIDREVCNIVLLTMILNVPMIESRLIHLLSRCGCFLCRRQVLFELLRFPGGKCVRIYITVLLSGV